MPILPSQRAQFDIPADVAYLNCAYMGPLSRAVAAASHDGLDAKRRPWTIRPADFFDLTDRARAAFARLLGAPATAEEVALVPAASYGMATAAANVRLGPGDRVVALAEEFPSTILTWRTRAREAGAELALLPRPADFDWTAAVLAALDERTRVAALPAVHWIDGVRLDLTRIAARVREVGAMLALDLTQSLGILPFDLAAVDPDYLVVACYKWLLSPYGTGFLYVAPRRREGRPLEQSWFGRAGSEDFSALTVYRDDFQPGARRYDVGESPNFALLPGVITALEQIGQWGVGNLSDTAGELAAAIVARGEALGLRATPAALRAPHYVALQAPGGLPAGVAERLAAERVYLSVRGGSALRITPNVYNEAWEVDRLFQVLEPALAPR